jgi:pimeloyl-ACP methyl ester carboxylesterase
MKRLFRILRIFFIIYVVLCGLLFFFQEKILFHPQQLHADFTFRYENAIERNFTTPDGETLNGLLFKADSTRGLIFYLHGNAGSLAGWGSVAGTYTELGYDVFMVDYRGYGKSTGSIRSEQQLLDDIQLAYVAMKKEYDEEEIIILGYSIGTGPAAKLAADNKPRLLILQAPYYSLTDMMHRQFSIIPTFLLKYRLPTHQYLQQNESPVVIFHGDADEVIPFESSLKLKEVLKPQDTLIVLPDQGHNGMTENTEYLEVLGRELRGHLKP